MNTSDTISLTSFPMSKIVTEKIYIISWNFTMMVMVYNLHFKCKKVSTRNISEMIIIFMHWCCLRSHGCISFAINFDAAKFCLNLLQDPILLKIAFNYISHLLGQYYVHHTLSYQIYVNGSHETYKFDIWAYDGHNFVPLDRKYNWK